MQNREHKLWNVKWQTENTKYQVWNPCGRAGTSDSSRSFHFGILDTNQSFVYQSKRSSLGGHGIPSVGRGRIPGIALPRHLQPGSVRDVSAIGSSRDFWENLLGFCPRLLSWEAPGTRSCCWGSSCPTAPWIKREWAGENVPALAPVQRFDIFL